MQVVSGEVERRLQMLLQSARSTDDDVRPVDSITFFFQELQHSSFCRTKSIKT